MLKSARRRGGTSGPDFRWKEPLAIATLWIGGAAIVLFSLVLLAGDEAPAADSTVPIRLLLCGIAVFVIGVILLHHARAVPGSVYGPGNVADAFLGLDDRQLDEIARALEESDGAAIEGVVRRATFGRFSRVLACVPGLCRRCSRALPTQGFLLFRALAVPWILGTIFVWEHLATRLCRDCATHALRRFTSPAEGGGGAALVAGLLWLPWNLPQFLLSRRLPDPAEEEEFGPGSVRRLRPQAIALVRDLRLGRPAGEAVGQAAARAGVPLGHAALFLAALGELSRRQATRSGGPRAEG